LAVANQSGDSQKIKEAQTVVEHSDIEMSLFKISAKSNDVGSGVFGDAENQRKGAEKLNHESQADIGGVWR
jgi:hypothetical protein